MAALNDAPCSPAVGDHCEVVHLHAWAGRVGRVREVWPDGFVTLDLNAATMYGLPDRYERLGNPFGDWRDGTGTAGVLRMVGGAVGGWRLGQGMGMRA